MISSSSRSRPTGTGGPAHFDEDLGHSIRTPGERAAWDRILDLVLAGRRALEVLDVGCGTGFLTFELAARGHRVTGVDFAAAMIAEARRKAAALGLAVALEEADAEALPFAPASFDLVISRHVLWTLPHPEAAIDGWIRVLRRGGRLAIVDGQFDAGALTTPPAGQRSGQRGVRADRRPAAVPRRPAAGGDRGPPRRARPDRRGQRSPARSRGGPGAADGRRRAASAHAPPLRRVGRHRALTPGATRAVHASVSDPQPRDHRDAASWRWALAALLLPLLVVVAPSAPGDHATRAGAPTAAISRTGTLGGAPYQIEVPADWRGGLVVFAHGIQRGPGPGAVTSPPLATHIVAEGHAWAASGYRAREYRPDWFIDDLAALRDLFLREVAL